MTQLSTDGRLYRSGDAWLGGVCSSVARRFDLDPIIVRILTVVLACATLGLGGVVYLGLWAFVPREPETGALYDVQPERAESIAFGRIDLAGHAQGAGHDDGSGLPIVARLAVAFCLMMLFLVISMGVSPIVNGTHWWQFWPLAWVICGICLMVVPVRSRHEVAWHAMGIAVTSLAAALLPVSLGVVAWSSFGVAFTHLWPLVLACPLLFFVGMTRDSAALMIVGALCLTAFFVLALLFFGVPGDVGQLMLNMPGGQSLRIAVVPQSA